MGRLPAALAVAVALLALVPSGNAVFRTPYEFIASRPDLSISRSCIDNLLLKNQLPWTATRSQDFTLFVPNDEGWELIFDYFGITPTPARFCTDVKRTKLNQTRNAVMKYHVLAGARTREQLPGDCPNGCQYRTTAGGKNLADLLTIAEEPEVGTYVIGGANDDYGDYMKFPNGTLDYNIAIGGRIIHVINAAMVQSRFIPMASPPPPPPRLSPSPPPPSPPPRSPPPSPPPPSPPPPPPPSPPPSPSPPPPPSPPPRPPPPSPPPPSPPPPAPPPPSPPPPSPPPPNPPPPSPPPPAPPPPSPPPPPGASPPPSPAPSPPPPSPRPPPSPYVGFFSIYAFLTQRVADQTRLKAMVEAADLITTFNNPALEWTCFFPNDFAPEWEEDDPAKLPAGAVWSTGRNSLIGQVELVAACKRVNNASDTRCTAAVNQFRAFARNTLFQYCVDRTGQPQITTATWSNATFPTVQIFVVANTSSSTNPNTYWVTLANSSQPSYLVANNNQFRNRDNIVGASIVQILDSFLTGVVSAPPPPPPPSPPPPSPRPPPPVFATITTAIAGLNELSVTRQLITLLNITDRINALVDTTCYFPSNFAWIQFGNNINDLGQFVSVRNNATAIRRRLLTAAGPDTVQFRIASGVIARATVKDARRLLVEVPNTFNPVAFYDRLAWNVSLEAPNNSYSISLLRNSILQSCYNPASAPGSVNVGYNTVAKLDAASALPPMETALGWGDLTGLSVIKTPFSGNCSDNATVGTLTGVPLETLGYCSQCAMYETVTDIAFNCSTFFVYSILTGGRSGFENGTISNIAYSRGRSPFVYWVPRDIVVGSYAQPRGFIQIVDRIVQSPTIPPPPPSPLPPSPPPSPFPPPPFTGLRFFLENTPGFQNCTARLFSQFQYYDYVQAFDTSGWTLFVPSDTACFAALLARGTGLSNVIANGMGRSIVKNMFVPNQLISSSAITNSTSLATDLGIFGNSSINNVLTFQTPNTNYSVNTPSIIVNQRFPLSNTTTFQSANITNVRDVMIMRAPSAGVSGGLAGYVHQIDWLLFPDITPPSPPPPPPIPPSPPAPSPPPPPPYFVGAGGFASYVANYTELSITKALMDCTNQTAPLDTFLFSNPGTFFAPTNTAWSNWFASTGSSQQALCLPANINSTIRLIRAHFIAGTYLSSDFQSRTPASVRYPYLFASDMNGLLLTVNASSATAVNVIVPMPLTTAVFVANRFNTILYAPGRPATPTTVGAAAAHMISAVLAVPTFSPPSPPPPPPPNAFNATTIFEGISRDFALATYAALLNLPMNSTHSFRQYLSDPSTVATVIAPSVDALVSFFSAVRIDNVTLTYGDCFGANAKAVTFCRNFIAYTIFPNVNFLPSFNSADYTFTSPIAGDSLRYAPLNFTSLAGPVTPIVYRLDLSTNPPASTSLGFSTLAFCSGDPRVTRGPVPVGIPNVLTQQQGLLYITNDVLLYSGALAAGVTYNPTATCSAPPPPAPPPPFPLP